MAFFDVLDPRLYISQKIDQRSDRDYRRRKTEKDGPIVQRELQEKRLLLGKMLEATLRVKAFAAMMIPRSLFLPTPHLQQQ